MSDSPLLSVVNITKTYEGVQALRGASLDLRAGEVHAMVGENGAGKSTLIKIITGAVPPDSGRIFLSGQPVTHHSPGISKSLGIAAIYQQPGVFPELTVTENIALGIESSSGWCRVDWKARRQRAHTLLDQLGANFSPEIAAGELTMPQQQVLEIARALGTEARILIMDEPTASLTTKDCENLFSLIGRLRDRGVAVLYISHRLEEIALIADRVTVLRDGTSIATHKMSDVTPSRLIQLMVGRELATVFPKQTVTPGATVLELRHLGCSAAGVHNVNLSLRAGEILGLAGLVGAGRTELAQVIFGLRLPDSGEIRLHGQAIRIQSPRQAIECGIAYLPEDRRRHGVILEMPITANITLASLDRLAYFAGLDFRREKDITAEYVRQLDIKTPSIFSAVGQLSGGNQQKVALSRWLATHPSVLILDEPTQGVDVGAKAEIHALMGKLVARGTAILMISSDLPEIMGMSDQIAVMRGGTIAAILTRSEATQQGILELALAYSANDSPHSGSTVN